MYRDNCLCDDVGISGVQFRILCEVFHAPNAAKHELIHALADLNHVVLKQFADLLFGIPPKV